MTVEKGAIERHTTVLPVPDQPPETWTLAQWQGLLEELHYQSDNMGERFIRSAHDGLEWLVAYFLGRRMNVD